MFALEISMFPTHIKANYRGDRGAVQRSAYDRSGTGLHGLGRTGY